MQESGSAQRPLAWVGEAVSGLHTKTVRRGALAHERPFLDTVRWLSAAAVAVGHAMGLVLTRQQGAPGEFLALNFFSDLRGPAVLLFFVISGYLVGGSVLLRADRFDFRHYVIARFSRIYIVLVPAILLICLLDGVAHLVQPGSPVYAHVWPSGVLGAAPIDQRYGAANWLATILSLESFVALPAGTGDALWSLGYEWVFYFVFPLLVVPLARFRSLLLPLIPCALLLLLAVAVGRRFDGLYFAVWLLGAYARVLVEYARVPRWFSWAGGAVVAIGVLACPLVVRPAMLIPVIGLGFAAYLSRFGPGERAPLGLLDAKLAAFSYSLYVTHFPVMIFLTFLANRQGLLPVQGRSPDATALLLVLAMVAVAAAVAFLFGALFEARTDRLRARLLKAMPGR